MSGLRDDARDSVREEEEAREVREPDLAERERRQREPGERVRERRSFEPEVRRERDRLAAGVVLPELGLSLPVELAVPGGDLLRLTGEASTVIPKPSG